MTLRDKRVVVIGGSSGIGFAVAAGVIAAGGRVVVASSGADKARDAAARLGDGASAETVDVRAEADVAAAFARIGAFDHLVFTAGDWGRRQTGPLTELDLDWAARLFGVRFWGALAAVKHALPRLAPAGSITLTNGMIAHRPRAGSAVSTAMAGSIEHLTRGLAVDLAPVRVNAVCPGLIRTEVWNSISEADRETRFRAMTERQPLPRIGEPPEAAEAYLYLLRAGYTTGQVLHVDGGGSIV